MEGKTTQAITVSELIGKLYQVRDTSLPVFVELADQDNMIAPIEFPLSTGQSDIFICNTKAGEEPGYVLIGRAKLYKA